MNNIEVTFDTNFMIKYKNDIHGIIKDIRKKYKAIIFNIVIEEIKGQKIRTTEKEYRCILDKINGSKAKNDWLKIIDNTKILKVFAEQEKSLDDWMDRTFNKDKISIDMKNFISQLLERSKYKKPPFNDAEDASDKGFKDTLLYLSIIEYINTSSTCEKIFLITCDKGFLNKKNELESEFFKITNKQLNIIDGEDKIKIYNILEIILEEDEIKNETNDVFPEINKNDDIEKARENFVNITRKIFSDKKVFIYDEMTNEKVESFLENLNDKMDNWIFVDTIDILKLLDVSSGELLVEVEDIRELIKQYKLMVKNESLKAAFIEGLKVKLNSYYVDLPF